MTKTDWRRFIRAMLAVVIIAVSVLMPGGVMEAAVQPAFVPSVQSSVKTAAQSVGANTSKIYVAKVENYTNCYAKRSTSSTVRGRLYRGCACYVVKTKGEWSYISSGSLKGWVRSKYLVAGSKASSLVSSMNPRVATVTANDLNVRTGMSTSTSIVANLPKGTKVIVLGEKNGWLKVRVTNTVTGYMYKYYTKIESGLYKGITKTMEKEMKDLVSKAENPDADEVTTPDPNKDSGKWVSLGTFKLTAYCPGSCCNGQYAGSTATGAKPTPGTTVAVDRNVIPLGSKIRIGDHVYIAQDTGVFNKTVDILVPRHSDCDVFGVQYKEVYIYRD